MFRFRKLSTKFILFVSLLVVLPIGAFAGIIINLQLWNINKLTEANKTLITTAILDNWEKDMRLLAILLSKELLEPMNTLDVYQMSHLAKLAAGGGSFRYVYVQDNNGSVLVDTGEKSELVGKVLTDDLTRTALDAGGVRVQRQAGIVDVSAPIMLRQERLGIVRIGFSANGIQEAVAATAQTLDYNLDKAFAKALRNTLLLLPIVLVPAFAAGWFALRGLTLPIKNLSEGTERIARGDLSYRVKTKSKDEIGQLTVHFNKMAENLQKTTVSKDYVNNIVATMSDMLVVATPEGVIQTINKAACDLLGYKEDELIGKSIDVIFAEERKISSENTVIEELIKSGSVHNAEKTYLSKYGRKIPVLFSGTIMRDIDGRIQGIVYVALDISERKKAESELHKLFLAVEQSGSIVIITDPEGNIEYTNPRFTEVTGYAPEEVIGKNPRILKSGRKTAEEYEHLWKTITSGKVWRGEFCNKKKNGELYWETASISPVKNPKGDITHFVGVTQDITERKQAEETIHRMAYYDTVTGLPNRTLFNDRLTVAIINARRRKEKLAVMFLDLDRFKTVNDTLGHTAGDSLLKNFAKRLKDHVREGDTISRQGGDEFTVLLTGIARTESISAVADKILEATREPFRLGVHELNITASMGISIYPNHGQDAETLLMNADAAMYHAKEQGRDNHQFYTPLMHARVAERLAIERNLREALRREEFVLHYQPQVDVKTGQIIGTESLIRWQHPERGLLFPEEFINVAEDTGLIVPISNWVLHTACAQGKVWQDAGLPPVCITVNLSSHTFMQQNLVEAVSQTLKETGLDPRRLELEITESTAMGNVEITRQRLNELSYLGINIAIDDFGTGYSSLSYIKSFPIHKLKIDRSFVWDITIDPNDAAIVTAIIAMAKSLKLTVVAEGVETAEQLEFLRSLGCDEIQGYLFSKPVPADEFKKMLEQDKRLQDMT